LTLVSFNDFGDLKWEKIKSQGRFFWERPFYVAINNVDQLVANEDKYVQKNTAFKQYNLMQKSYKTNLGFEHGLNLRHQQIFLVTIDWQKRILQQV
jgi:hemoglobin/transferrin/lactoferrin receptor protein